MSKFLGRGAETVLLASALMLPAMARADISFDFDTGAQGWTAINGASLVHQATGGNPGGFLEFTDTTSDDFRLVAPAAALGDWTSYLNGILSFDAKNINGESADYDGFGLITLTGAGSAGSITLDIVPGAGSPAAGSGWQTFSVVLSSAVWGSDLAAILADVASVAITGEFHAGVTEVGGFDNFALRAAPSSTVPEPSSLALFGLGLLAVWRWRARKG